MRTVRHLSASRSSVKPVPGRAWCCFPGPARRKVFGDGARDFHDILAGARQVHRDGPHRART